MIGDHKSVFGFSQKTHPKFKRFMVVSPLLFKLHITHLYCFWKKKKTEKIRKFSPRAIMGSCLVLMTPLAGSNFHPAPSLDFFCLFLQNWRGLKSRQRPYFLFRSNCPHNCQYQGSRQYHILIFMLNCMHAHKWLLTKISQALLETRLMVPYLLEQNKKMHKFKK